MTPRKWRKGRRTTLAADTLNATDWFCGKYATSNREIRSVSGGLQYVTEDVTVESGEMRIEGYHWRSSRSGWGGK